MRVGRVTVEGGSWRRRTARAAGRRSCPGKIIAIGLNSRAIEDPFALRPAQLTPPLA